jgi:hypothetical protein
VRNSTLHAALEAFTTDAAAQLAAVTAGGAEVPFELTEERGGRARLYCYRPLTGEFIHERLGMLTALPTYAPAARGLAELEGASTYLELRGERRIASEPRERADAALGLFLAAVFEERSQFGFDARRFETAYAELERALYEGRCLSTVVAPVLGVALDPQTSELAFGDGLSLMTGEALPDAPPDAVWGDEGAPNVLAVLSVVQERADGAPVAVARSRFRRVLTALRLFERGGYALGPIAWSRSDTGPWRTVALGSGGRPRLRTLIPAAQDDELRGFFNLIPKRVPFGLAARSRSGPGDRAASGPSGGGELSWARARFEMGCERLAPFEALTDYLLALRALLEPEGPHTDRLARRLSAICAKPEDRAELAQRITHAISLERAVIAGLAPGGSDSAHPVDALVDELAENLRAVLRDMVCGHLDIDVRAVADELLEEAVAAGA